jgi:hypothetical protein
LYLNLGLGLELICRAIVYPRLAPARSVVEHLNIGILAIEGLDLVLRGSGILNGIILAV